MEACLTRCCNGNAFLRALKPLNLRISNPPCRCYSMPIHSGESPSITLVWAFHPLTKDPFFFFSSHVVGGTKSLVKAYDALLLDAGGTLLQLVKPVDETYASIGTKYGLFHFSSFSLSFLVICSYSVFKW